MVRPPDPAESEQAEDTTYIDQAVAAADLLKPSHGKRGDILIFMPTESDIRETVQRLEEKRYLNTVIMPLFGRMAASDQQRIFAPITKDKIVVATNVAETSLTIPRIKYVIDTGLARIAQYNARSKTRSLPVAPISRASADQRKGRCGRVEAGICVRLYSETEYLDRPLYTPPEIQRSNLAEVILRMLYLKLGRVQDFPFLDPPSPTAIKDGFGVLRELGAVDAHRRLTPDRQNDGPAAARSANLQDAYRGKAGKCTAGTHGHRRSPEHPGPAREAARPGSAGRAGPGGFSRPPLRFRIAIKNLAGLLAGTAYN